MNQSGVERKNGRYLIPFIFTITMILLLISLTFMQNGTAGAASLPESAAHSPAAPVTNTAPSFADIYIAPRTDGAVTTMYQSVIGPDNCTSFGDPFSPLTSMWEPGIYTYTYRIRIPSEYMAAHDILRIELLDPDSWTDRSNGNYAIITHTETAVAHGYYSPTEEATALWNPAFFDNAFIDTGEIDVIGANVNGLTVTAEMINPIWFLRLESHFGECSAPFSYDPAHNNVTRYALYYYRDNGDTVERVDLSAYTGQTGGIDHMSHDTNLRWVSPALPNSDQKSVDQTVDVPVDAGSNSGFHLNISDNLDTDVPDIVTDQAGTRYIYMDVTAISGMTQNGYGIWAGPPEYTATVPSNINLRNLYLANNPGSHTTDGVTIHAVGRMSVKSIVDYPVSTPLLYVGAEYAGSVISVTQFDADQDTYPPVIFYFDTLDFEPDLSCRPQSGDVDGYCDGVDWTQTEWALSFGNNSDNIDPDGRSGRCGLSEYECASIWVIPAYTIEVPGDPLHCNKSALPPDGILNADPNSKICVPFSGGRLMVHHRPGQSDNFGWEVRIREYLPFIGEPNYVTHTLFNRPITVTVHISDALTGNNGIVSAMLHYSYTDPYDQVEIIGTGPGGNGEGLWTFIIPAQEEMREGETLSFWVSAINGEDSRVTAVKNNNNAYYPIEVEDDDMDPPLFTDLSYPTAVSESEQFTITVNISDTINGHGVLTATLHYGDVAPYNQHTIIGIRPSVDGNGIWTFVIPAQEKQFTFWLSATDGDNSGETAVDNNNNTYYSINRNYLVYLPIFIQ